MRLDRFRKQIRSLEWSSGTNARRDGNDLPTVVSSLSNEDLLFWSDRFKGLTLPFEQKIIERELELRDDIDVGPLWRQG